jgi:two-component system response regulator FixJ
MAFLDLNLPDGHGFEILEFIDKNKLDVIVAVISVLIDPDSIIKSFKLGAVDYLIKPVKEDALLNTIKNASKKREGELPLLQKNLNFTATKNLLTPREYEILKMIVSGGNYKNITDKLFISPNTLKVHTKSIFHKLLLKGRTEIVYHFNCCDIKDHLNDL